MQTTSLKHRQFTAQRPGYLADRVKTRIASFGQGFMEAGAGDAGLFGHLGHAHGPGSRIQRVDEIGLATGRGDLLQKAANRSGESRYLALSKGLVSSVMVVLHFVQQPQGRFYGFGLGGLVTAGQQQNRRIALDRIKNTIAGAKEEAQFKQPGRSSGVLTSGETA